VTRNSEARMKARLAMITDEPLAQRRRGFARARRKID
jgi:hypothetical protein